MKIIQTSIKENISVLFLVLMFTVAVFSAFPTTTAYADDGWGYYGDSYADYNYTDYVSSDGWSTGGDICTNCSDSWSDWGTSYNDYTYDDGFSDWGNSYNDYTYDDSYYSYNDNYYPQSDNYYSYDDDYYYSYDDNYYSYVEPTNYYSYNVTPQIHYSDPSSSYYYNNVNTNVNNTNINNVTNTNTNIVNTNTNTYPTYIPPVYIPQQPVVIQQYVQPRPVVTVASAGIVYDYVNINQVPYTGTDEIAYVLTLLAIALGAVAVFFFYRRNVANAFGSMVPSFVAGSVIDEEVEETTETKSDENEAPSTHTLTLEKGADGPKLIFK